MPYMKVVTNNNNNNNILIERQWGRQMNSKQAVR
jgi:hypothetical protein